MSSDEYQALDARLRALGFERPQTDLPTDADLDAFENSFGYALPQDYRWFLKHWNDAKIPDSYEYGLINFRLPMVRDGVVTLRRTRAFFGWQHFAYFEGSRTRTRDWFSDLDPAADPQLWTYLLLISWPIHQSWWYLDYRFDPDNPPVIVINDESADPDRIDWIDYGAPNFTEWILRHSLTKEEDQARQSTQAAEPYEHAEQVLKWQQSVRDHLAQFGNPDY